MKIGVCGYSLLEKGLFEGLAEFKTSLDPRFVAVL